MDDFASLDADTREAMARLVETGKFCRKNGDKPVEADIQLTAAVSVISGQDEKMHAALQAIFIMRLRGMEIRLPPLRERREDIFFQINIPAIIC